MTAAPPRSSKVELLLLAHIVALVIGIAIAAQVAS